MNLKNKIFFFDVNHTLINTATGHSKAMEMMKNVLIDAGIEKKLAKEAIKRVHFTTSLMIAGFLIREDLEWSYIPGGKEGYKELLFKIDDYQKGILDNWGFIKKWSREVFLKMAIDSLNIGLNTSLIKKAVDAHWEGITQHAEIFKSAKILFKELRRQQIPVYILTSSDGRLVFKNGDFVYDPEYSEEAKRNRMMKLKKQGLHFNDIIIGDPDDKPSVNFFKKGIKIVEKNLGRKIRKEELVMVGNSYEDDLETPIKKLGFKTGILIDEGTKDIKINGGIITLGNLTKIMDLL